MKPDINIDLTDINQVTQFLNRSEQIANEYGDNTNEFAQNATNNSYIMFSKVNIIIWNIIGQELWSVNGWNQPLTTDQSARLIVAGANHEDISQTFHISEEATNQIAELQRLHPDWHNLGAPVRFTSYSV